MNDYLITPPCPGVGGALPPTPSPQPAVSISPAGDAYYTEGLKLPLVLPQFSSTHRLEIRHFEDLKASLLLQNPARLPTALRTALCRPTSGCGVATPLCALR